MTDALKAAPTRKRRDPLWDNARFIAVTLVVVGHGIQRLTSDSDSALALYLFIYAFHMPAFAMISGYFSKSGGPSSRQMKKVLTDIVIPYAIMETIWSVVQYLVEGSTSINPTTPHWTLWFLLALALFRLVLPYLALLRWPLAWSVLFSVGVGYLSNIDNTFSLSRTIGILPFFVLGWQLRRWKVMHRWSALSTRAIMRIRVAAIAIFVAWFATVYFFMDTWREINLKYWFFYDDSYGDIVQNVWWAGLVRITFIILAVILCFSLFALTPRRTTWITGFGQATMYIYLLHSFILYPIRQSGILGGDHDSELWLVSMVLASIGISIVLASPLIRRVFRPLIEPKPQWLFVPLESDGDKHPARRGPSRVDPTGSRRDT